jgi:DNA-binding phage protein
MDIYDGDKMESMKKKRQYTSADGIQDLIDLMKGYYGTENLSEISEKMGYGKNFLYYVANAKVSITFKFIAQVAKATGKKITVETFDGKHKVICH